MNIKNIHLQQKTIVLMGVILITFMIVAVSFLLLMRSSEEPTGQSPSPEPIDKVLAKGMEYSQNGDFEGGFVYYDEQIEQRDNKTEKQQLLLYKSSFASQQKKPEVALESAKQADEIESTPASLTALAQAYDSNGDKSQAISYYKKLIELAPSEEGMGSRYVVEWEQRIKELEQ